MNDGEDPRSEDADDAKPAHEAGEQDGTPGAEGAGTEEPTGKQKKSLFKKPVFWIILVIVVAAIAIGGTLYYLHARQYESTDDAFVDAHIVRLAAQEAGTRPSTTRRWPLAAASWSDEVQMRLVALLTCSRAP